MNDEIINPSEEKLSPKFFNKDGDQIAGLTGIPVQYATRFIEFSGLRYQRTEDGSYHEVGKAQIPPPVAPAETPTGDTK